MRGRNRALPCPSLISRYVQWQRSKWGCAQSQVHNKDLLPGWCSYLSNDCHLPMWEEYAFSHIHLLWPWRIKSTVKQREPSKESLLGRLGAQKKLLAVPRVTEGRSLEVFMGCRRGRSHDCFRTAIDQWWLWLALSSGSSLKCPQVPSVEAEARK